MHKNERQSSLLTLHVTINHKKILNFAYTAAINPKISNQI